MFSTSNEPKILKTVIDTLPPNSRLRLKAKLDTGDNPAAGSSTQQAGQ